MGLVPAAAASKTLASAKLTAANRLPNGPSGEIFKGRHTPALHGRDSFRTPGKPGTFKAGSVTDVPAKGKLLPNFWAAGKAIAACPWPKKVSASCRASL
jgi:hypothetical protein